MALIVHLTTVHPRADGRILVKEARTLAARLPQHRVILMVADGLGHADAPPGDVAIHDLGSPGHGRLGRAIVAPWRALGAIRRMKPAVVHFHDPELIPLGFVLEMLGHRVVYDVHEDYPRQARHKLWAPRAIVVPLSWLMSAIEWVAARTFSGIAPATPAIAERFPPAKTVALQNFPVVSELTLPSPTPYAQRPLSFVYPGILANMRGTLQMVQAIDLLRDIPGVRLDLAGTFVPESYIETVKSLPGWSAVTWHGELSRSGVAELLGSARVGMVVHGPVPNEIEAQPIKMYEYMSAGLPIIASDFPRWRQIVDGIDCALLVDPLDPAAIAAAMRWLLEHPDEAEAMGARGREAVARRYNWDVEADKMVAMYDRLLAGSAA